MENQYITVIKSDCFGFCNKKGMKYFTTIESNHYTTPKTGACSG